MDKKKLGLGLNLDALKKNDDTATAEVKEALYSDYNPSSSRKQNARPAFKLKLGGVTGEETTKESGFKDLGEEVTLSKRGLVGHTPSHAKSNPFGGMMDGASISAASPMAASEISKKF